MVICETVQYQHCIVHSLEVYFISIIFHTLYIYMKVTGTSHASECILPRVKLHRDKVHCLKFSLLSPSRVPMSPYHTPTYHHVNYLDTCLYITMNNPITHVASFQLSLTSPAPLHPSFLRHVQYST